MLRSRVLTALALALLLIGAILYSPPQFTAAILGLILVIGAWEWSAFLAVAACWRLLYVLVLAACGAGWRCAYTLEPRRFAGTMSVATAWWLLALLWVVDRAATRRSDRRRRWPACWRCCPPGSRWCASTCTGTAARSGRCSSWRWPSPPIRGPSLPAGNSAACRWRRACRQTRPGRASWAVCCWRWPSAAVGAVWFRQEPMRASCRCAWPPRPSRWSVT